MSKEIEDLLEKILWNFEYKRKKYEHKDSFLFTVFDDLIKPTMETYMSIAKQKGFIVEAKEKKTTRTRRYDYVFSNTYKDKLIEVRFSGNLDKPKIDIHSEHSFKGFGGIYDDDEAALKDITKQTIDDIMLKLLKEISEKSLGY